jgi:hypothetical protein
MRTMLKTVARALAANLNPVESGVHYHAGSAGPYACQDPRCVTPGVRRRA